MAIDARISLAGVVPQTQSGSTVVNTFQNNLNQAQNRRANEQAFQQQELLNPIRRDILQQQALDAPVRSELLQQGVARGQQQIDKATEERTIQLASEFGNVVKPALAAGDTEQAITMFQGHIADLQSKGLPTQGAEQIVQQLQAGNIQGVTSAIDAVQQNARQRGLVSRTTSVGQRDFQTKVDLVKGDPELTTPAAKAAAIDLGLEARASTSAQERIATDAGLGERVVEQKSAEAGATEGAKLTKQLKHKPEIMKAVKLAEKEATERGDVLTDLARMEASLPGVKEVVSELVELSEIATSTLGGRAFDAVVKQSGFGSTKGADARAKMIAIVDNQVLPLLKETFGAAFTVAEGDNLKASLVDPDASPSQKKAQLDAFLAQKERNIRTKQTQVNQTFNFDAQGNLIE